MKTKFLFRVAVLALGLGALALASPITVKLGGSGSTMGGPTQGVYYYPYTLNVGGTNVTVACDDYFDEVQIGESWLATVNTFADLSHTLFYNSGSGVATYEKAAWLFSQFESQPLPDNSVNAAINFAMWDLFDSSAPGINTSHPGQTTSSTYWINEANLQDLSGFDFSRFVIYTPSSGWPSSDGRPQEYIGEVPEPATGLLWLTCLGAVGLMTWRRRWQQDAA